MPYHEIIEHGERVGILCVGGPFYDCDGFLFAVHSYMGPCPLNRRTHSPQATIPSGFWEMLERFETLGAEEQNTYCVST